MSLLAGAVTADETNESEKQIVPRRLFAIATKLVTVEQFLRFQEDHKYDKRVSPEPTCPVNSVSWYAAVAYCNWLSEREGISRDQWCYLPNDKGDFAEGMGIPSDCLQRTGYRLATETEWEYACRAGSTTEYCFGDAEEMLANYACYDENSGQRMFPVGSLKPNDFGLFDMHGNAWEWCQSRYDTDAGKESSSRSDQRIRDEDSRVLRGGSFLSDRADVHSPARYGADPDDGWDVLGFRVARTYD
jgi:formylglycine-generating enzyme required for sulfatase activity